MKERINFYAQRERYGRGISLHIVGGSAAGSVCFAPLAEGEYAPPAIEFSNESAQQLMDELWACGIRPADGAGSAGQAAAMQSHLNDLRAIAFKTLRIKP